MPSSLEARLRRLDLASDGDTKPASGEKKAEGKNEELLAVPAGSLSAPPAVSSAGSSTPAALGKTQDHKYKIAKAIKRLKKKIKYMKKSSAKARSLVPNRRASMKRNVPIPNPAFSARVRWPLGDRLPDFHMLRESLHSIRRMVDSPGAPTAGPGLYDPAGFSGLPLPLPPPPNSPVNYTPDEALPEIRPGGSRALQAYGSEDLLSPYADELSADEEWGALMVTPDRSPSEGSPEEGLVDESEFAVADDDEDVEMGGS